MTDCPFWYRIPLCYITNGPGDHSTLLSWKITSLSELSLGAVGRASSDRFGVIQLQRPITRIAVVPAEGSVPPDRDLWAEYAWVQKQILEPSLVFTPTIMSLKDEYEQTTAKIVYPDRGYHLKASAQAWLAAKLCTDYSASADIIIFCGWNSGSALAEYLAQKKFIDWAVDSRNKLISRM